jgi:hypothetical protein
MWVLVTAVQAQKELQLVTQLANVNEAQLHREVGCLSFVLVEEQIRHKVYLQQSVFYGLTWFC